MSSIILNEPKIIQVDEDLFNDMLKTIDSDSFEKIVQTHAQRKKDLKHLKTKEATEEDLEELHSKYNKIKDKHIKIYDKYLKTIAKDISEKAKPLIDDWATKKNQQLKKAQDNDYSFDWLDLIFFFGIIGAINTITRGIPSSTIEEYTGNAYTESASYYQNLELNNIENTIGQRPTPKYDVSYTPTSPKIYNQFNNYTMGSLKTIGNKYRPSLEKIIKEGYENGESVDTIASKLKRAVNPNSKFNKTNHIFERIAQTEMAYYTELGKLDSWRSIGIEKKYFLSRRDARVCPICMGYDGTVLELDDDSIFIPVHPRCRCCWIPIYDPNMWLVPLIAGPLLIDNEGNTYENV